MSKGDLSGQIKIDIRDDYGSKVAGAVDHHASGWVTLDRKVGEDSVEDTHAGPANEPVVERLVGAMDSSRIPPSQTIPNHGDYPASQHAGRPRAKCHTFPGKAFNAL